MSDPLDKMAENARELGIQMQPAQQEPYGYVSTHTNGQMHFNKTFQGVYTDTATGIVAVYTAPQTAQRKPLTDEEVEAVWKLVQANDFHDCVQPFARAIEAAHGIKENT